MGGGNLACDVQAQSQAWPAIPSCAVGDGVKRRSRSPRFAVNSHSVRTETEYCIAQW
jgi:hypothetical protein